MNPLYRPFAATLAPAGVLDTVGALLDRRVDLVRRAFLRGDPAAADFLGRGAASTRAAVTPTVDDVRLAIAHEHGFADWPAVLAHRDRLVDPHFEAAVDAIVLGDLAALDARLTAQPDLAQARSPFGHRATLVHYITANGVESTRQWRSPGNAVELLRSLLHHGADPDAPCYAYGGAITPLCLLVPSVHPADGGVQADLVVELCRGGARPDGLDDDGMPMWTAITSGYPAAVDALARSGARVDNVVFAAALGDPAAVDEYLDGGEPAPTVRSVHGRPLDPSHLAEYALIYAAGLGRRAVVEHLLARDPDLAVVEPVHRSTAAGRARYHGYQDILALLEAGPDGPEGADQPSRRAPL